MLKLYIQKRRRLYIIQDIKSTLLSDDKLSKMYACAFQKWKTNYRIGFEYYYPKKRNVIDYIKTKPEYFNFEKHNNEWRIKSKITPLINLLEELFILNGKNQSHKDLLKDMFKGNKDKLKSILDGKEFRNFIDYKKGINNTREIVNIIGLVAIVSYSAIIIHQLYAKKLIDKYKVVTDMKKLQDITYEITEKTIKNFKVIDKNLTDEQIFENQEKYKDLNNLGIKFGFFKPIFLFELSKLSTISKYAYYIIVGSHSMAKTINEL